MEKIKEWGTMGRVSVLGAPPVCTLSGHHIYLRCSSANEGFVFEQSLTLTTPRAIFFFCAGGREGGGAPLHNFARIKGVTMILGGEIIRPKVFPLRSATKIDYFK